MCCALRGAGWVQSAAHRHCFLVTRCCAAIRFPSPCRVLQESDFFDLLQLYFPKLYDIKYLVSSQDGFHGGLNKLADDLKVAAYRCAALYTPLFSPASLSIICRSVRFLCFFRFRQHPRLKSLRAATGLYLVHVSGPVPPSPT